MSDINQKIIEMIKQNKSMKEIALLLNISPKQVYVRIKQILNYGYQIDENYTTDGNVFYKLIKNFQNEKKEIKLGTKSNQNYFRALVISDNHIGNIESKITLLNDVYEYAAKNNINIIFNCGDIIEGDYTSDQKSIKNINEQVEYLIKKYPYDKDIINIMILGNHDLHSITTAGLDVSKKIKNNRYDMITIGNSKGIVNIKNDSLALIHAYEGDIEQKLVFSGHGHMMKIKINPKMMVRVPTLSYKSTDSKYDVVPGFIDVNINFMKDRFDLIELKHMIIAPKVIQAGEYKCKMKSLLNNNYNIRG